MENEDHHIFGQQKMLLMLEKTPFVFNASDIVAFVLSRDVQLVFSVLGFSGKLASR